MVNKDGYVKAECLCVCVFVCLSALRMKTPVRTGRCQQSYVISFKSRGTMSISYCTMPDSVLSVCIVIVFDRTPAHHLK